MANPISRRSLLLGAGALLALPGCKSTTSQAAEPLKLGFMYSGPIGDVGWTYQHELGRRMVEKEFGSRIKTTFVENVPESADAERVIRQLVDEGCKMVFATSFGFMESMVKVAKDFPDVVFEHATGYKTAKNLGVYQSRFYEGAYLLGIVAGKMTKSNTLGFVASFPIPEVLRNIDAWTMGAKSVNPAVKTKVIWINSWYDPPREKEAGEALANQGADVFYQNTDSPALVQMAEQRSLFAFGQDSDMIKYGQKAELSANTVNWGIYYLYKVKQMLAGAWKSEDTKWGMKEGMIEVTPLNAAVPADVQKLFEDKKAAIKAGTFHPFAGPVTGQDGTVKVAAGQTIADSELWGLKWYVDGVDGKLPD
ncbi:MAG TPA: BMP family ABC transporter substrate-binding protein [Polyangiaceae bacterium]|jgi:simple sugar transport system substrate-binding protein|nr:BMP family ABC transporter substrate-binding protein [Polyangiaceae bacterium]